MENKTVRSDAVMTKVWLHIVEDFRAVYGHNFLSDPVKVLLQDGIVGLRGYSWPARSVVKPHLFKALYQAETFMKRYRYEKDAYTDAELTDMAITKFCDDQVRCAAPLHVGALEFKVLQRARYHVRRILGEYDSEEHELNCRFGKRACVGFPYIKSYLDVKLDGPLTGTAEDIAWFSDVLERDQTLRAVVMGAKGEPIVFKTTTSLPLALVPKSFKAFRTMLPNTLLGSFRSYGLGRIIQSRLKDEGLNIQSLQMKHRRLAQTNSRTRSYVTADLSSASDSITLELLRRLLPSKWYRVITAGRSRFASVLGKDVLLSSVVTMGLGHTFPLQTLVFYCLLKAIGDLVGSEAYVSVYGDDLIYTRRIHKYVERVFPSLHLRLNRDKTYVEDFFRESCGGDYCRGIDVRPFQPEGGIETQNHSEFIPFLYKLYNGLRLRWEECELPKTFGYLLNLIYLHDKEVMQVPPSFPSGSGIQVDKPISGGIYSPVLWGRTTHTFVFRYHAIRARYRPVTSCYPYYWENLRAKNGSEESSPWDDVADDPVLVWRKTSPPEFTRSRITGRRFRRLVACVARKSSGYVLVQTGSTSSWI